MKKGLVLLIALTWSGFITPSFSAQETWTKKTIRVMAQAKNAEGKVVPIVGQEALIWLNKASLQKKIDEAIRRYHYANEKISKPYLQMNYILKALGKPDVRKITDMNGNAFFDGVKLSQKAFCIVINQAPHWNGGGVYVGVKQPGELRAICLPVNQEGLVHALRQLHYPHSVGPLTPHQLAPKL